METIGVSWVPLFNSLLVYFLKADLFTVLLKPPEGPMPRAGPVKHAYMQNVVLYSGKPATPAGMR